MPVDVVIVGAGPAGSLAAFLLSTRGARVVLVDPTHPREKACGGGLTERALGVITPLVPLTNVPAVHVQSVRFVDLARRRSVTVPLPGQATVTVMSRNALDAALFDAAERAGTAIVRARAIDVSVSDRARVFTADGRCIEADFVVGADGANSLVRRRLAVPFGRSDLSVATGVYAHGITSTEIVLEMVGEPPGYIWSFPRPDHLAIGICAQATDTGVARLKAAIQVWTESSGIAHGARLEPYSWPIPSLSSRSLRSMQTAGARWFTVGDAAGLVDPITREGILYALQSAQFLVDALTSGSPSAGPRWYQERVTADIVDELCAAARLKQGFFRPVFARLMTDALESSGRIRAVMADLIAGVQPYRSLRRRLAGTFELGLAWKWLRERQRSA